MDGFMAVLESNKIVVSKHRLLIGKDYDRGVLFRFSLANFYNGSVDRICGTVNDNASI